HRHDLVVAIVVVPTVPAVVLREVAAVPPQLRHVAAQPRLVIADALLVHSKLPASRAVPLMPVINLAITNQLFLVPIDYSLVVTTLAAILRVYGGRKTDQRSRQQTAEDDTFIRRFHHISLLSDFTRPQRPLPRSMSNAHARKNARYTERFRVVKPV